MDGTTLLIEKGGIIVTPSEWSALISAIPGFVAVFISWPVVIGVCLVLFRSQIRTLLLNIRRVSREGIDFGEAIQSTPEGRRLLQNLTPTEVVTGHAAPSVGTPSGTVTIFQVGDTLAPYLDARLLDEVTNRIAADVAAQQLTPDRAIALLTRQLAVLSMAFALELVYWFIWGSQLAILQFLATAPGPVPVDQVRSYYAAATQQYPAAFASYPFEQYLNFLTTTTTLANRTNNTLEITPLGRELLAYIQRTGRTTQKPL